jgi:Intrinsic membrane protein PufX
MSDKPYFQEQNHTIHLRVWALGQMVWGAFLAGVVLVAVLAVLVVIYFAGQFLPEDSKTAPDPNTWDTVDRGEP